MQMMEFLEVRMDGDGTTEIKSPMPLDCLERMEVPVNVFCKCGILHTMVLTLDHQTDRVTLTYTSESPEDT